MTEKQSVILPKGLGRMDRVSYDQAKVQLRSKKIKSYSPSVYRGVNCWKNITGILGLCNKLQVASSEIETVNSYRRIGVILVVSRSN